MIKCLHLTSIAGALAVSLAAATAKVTGSQELPGGGLFAVDGGTLRVQFWSAEIVRVTYAPSAELPVLKSLSVVSSPETVRLTWRQNDEAFSLGSSDLQVKVDKQTGAVSFLGHDGHVLLRETAEGRKMEPATVAGAAVNSCAQSFELSPDEGILS